jgi:acetyltransferase
VRGGGDALSIRNFDALFAPKAIALIGAGNEPRTAGRVLADNLYAGGFAGPILTVSGAGGAIRSTLSYKSVAELPVTPDLAVIAMPAAAVPALVAELGARGCRAAIIVGDGLGHGAGGDEQDAMLAAARPHLLRLVGPNSLGLLSPATGLNASLAPATPATGDIAFLTQSGAVMTSVLDRAAAHAIGFSHVVSLGGMADVDVGDMLDFLAGDRRTRAVLMYVDSITDARKFMSAARAAGRLKPVVVVKAGRSAGGARAARSHTGTLTGTDAVYEAAFRRAGLLRVGDLRELFEAAATLAGGLAVEGDRLLIVTNGGGVGVLATDALEAQGGRLAELSAEAAAAFAAAVPGAAGNPVSLGAHSGAARYEAAVAAALAAPGADAVLVLNAPTALADRAEAADGVVAARARGPRRPLLACWLGEATARAGRSRLEAARVPTYATPDAAVRAFLHLVAHRRNRALLMQVPEAAARASAAAIEAARATIEAAVAAGRSVLTDAEAMGVLAGFDIPTVATRIVPPDPAAAAAEAARIGFPAVLKILSPDIAHKSEVGGVRLALVDAAAVEAAARTMLATVAARAPGARVDGFVVQAMADRPRAHELVCGLTEDATFGPVVLVGAGGTAVEVLDDHSIGLPPLDPTLARDMIARTRVARLLAGYGDRPPADVEAVAAVLVALSEIAVALPNVVELDINPLVADADGVLALDARIVIAPVSPGRRLAIRPYPRSLERRVDIPGGERFEVRPIRPEDAPALAEMVRLSTSEDLRLRFFAPVIELSAERTARLTQIDYDREMALVAVAADAAIVGVVRLIADPENDTAEYAVMVRSDMKGRGLGSALMQAILDYARARGTARVVGTVLRENTSMLRLCADLGFTVRPDPDDPGIVIVEHSLHRGA